MARGAQRRVTSLERSRRLAPPDTGPKLGDSALGRAMVRAIVAQQECGADAGIITGMQLGLSLSAGLAAFVDGEVPAHIRVQVNHLFAAEKPDGVAGAHWSAEKQPDALAVFDQLVMEGHL